MSNVIFKPGQPVQSLRGTYADSRHEPKRPSSSRSHRTLTDSKSVFP